MVENGTSQPKRRIISINEYLEMAKTSGDPLSFNPAEIIRDAEHFRNNTSLFDEEKFGEKLQELHDKKEGSKDLNDRVKSLQDEITDKDKQIKELDKLRNESLEVLRGFVGEKLADRIQDLPDSIRKLVSYVKSMAESYKSLQTRLKSAEENEQSRLQVAQDAVNGFFLSFNHILDIEEKGNTYRVYGQPVERMLSVDGAEIVSKPENPIQVIIHDSQLANAVLEKIAKNYDSLHSSACGKAASLQSSVDAFRKELERRGLSQKDVDALLEKSGSAAAASNKHMEQRKQIDDTVGTMSREELAYKFTKLKQEYEQALRDKAAVEEQKKILESRRADVHAVLKELSEIDGILEQSEFYTSNPMSALGLSSSKIIESIPEELRKRKNALADIVVESIKLQKLVDEKDKLIAENSKLISSQKDELQKRKVLFVPDPVLKSIFSRFIIAYDVNNKYAAANNLPPEVLPGFSVKSEEGIQVLLDNYLSVLTKMRDTVIVDIVSAENQLWKKYGNIKPDAALKDKKDVHLLRKHVSSLISAEAGRVVRNIQSVKSMLESIHIPLEKLLETTGFTNLDVACLSSYVTPIYEKIAEIEAIPEKQAKLASKYGFASYAELKSKVDSELSFNDVKRLASAVDKSVRTKKEAAAFQRRLKSEVSSLDCSKIDSAKEEIEKGFLVPSSYDAVKLWVTDVYNRLPAISNGSEEKTKLAKMVKGKRSFVSSIDYLKGFVNDAGFAKIDDDLAYFAPAKKILGDFNSGAELHNLLCEEIRKVEAYKSARQTFK